MVGQSRAEPAVILAALAALAACALPEAPSGTSQAPGRLPAAAASGAIPAGSSQGVAELAGLDGPLQVFTFKPDGCAISAVLLVFHGVNRNAGPYRDAATPLGQRYCMLVIAPLFDEARFPSWRYQRGGIVHNGAVQPPARWTVGLVPRLVAWAQAREGRPDLPYALLGHSAGAQFLSRVAAYGSGRAERIVIANPSTWVRPSLEVAAPYGFGAVFEPAEGEAALRRYLALPVTVLLGREDTGARNLATGDEAEEQGATRIERGENVFKEAEAAARARGRVFNWRLAVVPGVGHDARRMFTADAAFAALQPGAARPSP